MGFPYDFQENFESGTKGNFDSESDDGKRLDFPHQSDLPPGMMPAHGAFCCRVNLGKNSENAYLAEAVNITSGNGVWGRFNLFLDNVQFGNDLDRVTLVQFYSGTDDKEAALVLARVEPFGTVLAVETEGETWNDTGSYLKVKQESWVTVEFRRRVDSSFGFMSVIMQELGRAVSERKADATNTSFRLGALYQTGDIQGTLYFDDFILDNARLFEDGNPLNGALSGGSLLMVQSGFAFLGKGEVEHITVVDESAGDCRVKVYDTDYPTRLPAGGLRYDVPAPGAGLTGQSTSRRVPFKRGAYVQLSGTNPQAIIRLGTVASDRGAKRDAL